MTVPSRDLRIREKSVDIKGRRREGAGVSFLRSHSLREMKVEQPVPVGRPILAELRNKRVK